jgi:hypothetical protein
VKPATKLNLSVRLPFSSASNPSTVRPLISISSPVTSSLLARVCSLSKNAAVRLKSSDIATLTPTSELS